MIYRPATMAVAYLLLLMPSISVALERVPPGLKTSGFPIFTTRATSATTPISKAPKPFIHPRLYFLSEDLPALREQLLLKTNSSDPEPNEEHTSSRLGVRGFLRLKEILLGTSKDKWTDADVSNTPLFKGPYKALYDDLLKAPSTPGVVDLSPKGLRQYGRNVILHAKNVAENGFGHVGLYGKLSGAAFVSMIVGEDEPPFSSQELGKVLGATCRNHRPIWKDEDKREFGFFHDSPDDLGTAYDWLYNAMGELDRKECRTLIAKMTGKNRREFGAQYAEFPWSGFNWNWIGWHETIVVLAASIEGEDEASDYERWANDCHDVQSRYFLTESSEAGLAIEGLGYHTLALNGALTATMITARSRENLFEQERTRNALYRMVLYRVYTAEPWIDQLPDNLTSSSQDAFAHGDSPNRHRPRSAIVLRKYFPTDPLVAWAFKNAGNIDHQEPLMSALMMTRSKPVGAHESLEALAETINLPVNYFCRERGEMIVRNHWKGDATVLDFETKMNALSLGHNHADRNSFYLYARGRAWIIDNHHGDVENAAHQTVLIDGVGQGGGATPRGADTFPSMPGVFLEYAEGTNNGIEYVAAVGDAKPAYDFAASCSPEAQKDGYSCVPSPYKRRDFVYPPAPYINLPRFEGLTNTWMDDEKANWRLSRKIMSFNPVLRAFRSTLFVKTVTSSGESSPWILVTDDIQKDETERKYEFVMNLPWASKTKRWQYRHNHEQVVKDDAATNALGRDTDVILKDVRDPETSGPRLLVRVLNTNGFQGIKYHPLRKIRTRRKITKTDFREARHLVVEAKTKNPDFRIFIFPHEHGDSLPETKLENGILSVTIDGANDTKWTMTKLPSGRTRISPVNFGETRPARQAPTSPSPTITSTSGSSTATSGARNESRSVLATSEHKNNTVVGAGCLVSGQWNQSSCNRRKQPETTVKQPKPTVSPVNVTYAT